MNIFNKENKFYLEVGAVKYEIIEPIKFDQIEFILKRDIDKHGFNTEIINPNLSLEFDCNTDNASQYSAADIIKDVYNSTGNNSPLPIGEKSKGNDGVIIFIFGEVDKTTQIFTEVFKGKINLNSLKETIYTVSATIERVSFEDLLRTRVQTKIDITTSETIDGATITPLTPEVIELHSKVIQKEFKAYIPEQGGSPASLSTGTINDIDLNGIVSDYLQFGFFEIEFNEINIFDLPFSFTGDILPVDIYKVVEAGEHTFNWRFKGNLTSECANGSTETLNLDHRIILSITGQPTQIIYQDSFSDLQTDIDLISNFDTTGSYTATLSEDDEIRIYVLFDANTPSPSSFNASFEATFEDLTFFQILAKTQTTPTQANTFLIYEALDKLIEVTTGQSDKLRSTLIGRTDSSPRTYLSDGCASLLSLVNGYQIRNFPILERPPFLSIDNIIDFLNTCFNIGCGYEIDGGNDVLRIEKREYFFNNVELLDVGEVAKLQKQTAKELLYNEIEIGYKKWADEQFNNLDEFNTIHEYSTGIKSIKRKLSLISPILASGYLIEFLRREQYADTKTKDHENDKENFIIQLFRGIGFETEKNEPIEAITGVIDPPTLYNIRLSPKRNLIRWINFFKSILTYKDQTTHFIKFLFGEGNYLMNSNFLDTESCEFIQAISESENLLLNLFNNEYFTPEWVTFEKPLSFEDLLTIKNALSGQDLSGKNYGFISYTDENGNKKSGWIYEIKYKGVDTNVKFKLLNKE